MKASGHVFCVCFFPVSWPNFSQVLKRSNADRGKLYVARERTGRAHRPDQTSNNFRRYWQNKTFDVPSFCDTKIGKSSVGHEMSIVRFPTRPLIFIDKKRQSSLLISQAWGWIETVNPINQKINGWQRLETQLFFLLRFFWEDPKWRQQNLWSGKTQGRGFFICLFSFGFSTKKNEKRLKL